MKLIKIDKHGNMVNQYPNQGLGDVVLDKRPTIFTKQKDEKGNDIDVEIFDPLYRTEKPPEGLYRPKWDFDNKKWVEGMAQAEIDALKLASIPQPNPNLMMIAEMSMTVASIKHENEQAVAEMTMLIASMMTP